MMIIAIDPGVGGGIACRDSDKRIWADPMPEGMTEIYDYFKNLTEGMCQAILEMPSGYMPGNSGKTAIVMFRNIGHIEMALYALGISVETVSPQKWMKPLNLPKEYGERKKAIREKMQRQFPSLKVTLKTADALGLLVWYLEKLGRH